MDPRAFCAAVRRELASAPGGRNDAWVRGALALCELYQGSNAERFGEILAQLARGPTGSATAAGARWLLARWGAARPAPE